MSEHNFVSLLQHTLKAYSRGRLTLKIFLLVFKDMISSEYWLSST